MSSIDDVDIIIVTMAVENKSVLIFLIADLGIPDADDCATGSFCSSCAIPPRVVGGLWSAGVGCDACYFPFGVIRFRRRG